MKTFAVHCLGRMGFGHKITNNSSDLDDFEALGNTDDERLSAYLTQQLNWQSINNNAFDNMVVAENYVTLNKPLVQMWQDHHVNSSASGFNRDGPAEEMERLAVARAMHSKRQLLEILSDFWHNHFNVYSRDYYTQSTLTSWDRDVIRPPISGHPRPAENVNGHLLGNFRQMLELSSKHIAMGHYLDNYINQVAGPNENYAREIIELHTLGAENYVSLGDPNSISQTELDFPWGTALISDKYVDDDVYAAMRMLTGWKMKDSSSSSSANNQDTGEFYYYEAWHDKFEKTILGYEWGNFEANPEDIIRFLDILAYHPGTARHIAGKLCRRFISDTPSQAIIDAVADTFYQNRYAANQLELVYQTLFLSNEFKDPSNYNSKLKRPFELMVGALRASGSDFMPKQSDSDTNSIVTFYLQRAGQRPFIWPAPNGFPDEKEHWSGGTVLIYIMRFYDWMLDKNYNTPDRIVPMMDITLNASIVDLPSHTPNNLTTFWMNRILGYEPAGGWLGTELHTSLRDFMRQNSNDPQQWPADSPFPDITTLSNPYIYERLRGLVKLILSTPEFMYR
ncbi:MAG: DUF1800 domain-containing protein [Alcanivoracaceae bacterium]|nr:DUF1800 domain-containing protein [Alcanivoracaceae bacterium]